jgi:hypothetical protein
MSVARVDERLSGARQKDFRGSNFGHKAPLQLNPLVEAELVPGPQVERAKRGCQGENRNNGGTSRR